MIGQLFRNNRRPSQAETLYGAIADLALRPAFFAGGGAPDTVEGRFDVLALHMGLVLSRLRQDEAAARALAEPLQREFFASLDDAMRRLGVGDMSVARKVRRMAEAFYGRFIAYEKALEESDKEALERAISRNIFGAEHAPPAALFAAYMLDVHARLAATGVQDLAPALEAMAKSAALIFEEESRKP
jgi:cytochrome b pre-mRNA-processing protein 3